MIVDRVVYRHPETGKWTDKVLRYRSSDGKWLAHVCPSKTDRSRWNVTVYWGGWTHGAITCPLLRDACTIARQWTRKPREVQEATSA